MEENFDVLFKILIIGDSGVGKTNLASRYIKNEFIPETKATVGVEFGEKRYVKNGIKIKAQLWDTAGQERYRSIASMYYKGAKGAFIVYDITSKESFKSVDRWYGEIKRATEPNLSVILIGNKYDLTEKRLISIEQGKEKAKDLGVPFLETSALSNRNVERAFTIMIEDIFSHTTIEKYEDFEIQDLNEVDNDKPLMLKTDKEFGDGEFEKSSCCDW